MVRLTTAGVLSFALIGCGGGGGGDGGSESSPTSAATTSVSADDGATMTASNTASATDPTATDPSATAGSSEGPTDASASADSSGSGGSTTGAEVQSMLLAAIGDFGNDSDEEAAVAALVASWNPDHVITLGDNNYPDGEAETIDDHIGQYYYPYIGNYVGGYGKGSPENRFWPSPGNHDWNTDTLDPYLGYFTLPGNERYYEMDLGLVHLFAVDSDPHEPDGIEADSVQAQWLQGALAASTACWKLVYFHHAAYSSAEHGSNEDLQWPYEEWGADAVLAGHDHSYERAAVGGIPYFVNGLGGAGTYDFPEVIDESVVRYNENHGAMTIAISTTDITFEFVNVDGEVIDTHTIQKNCAAR